MIHCAGLESHTQTNRKSNMTTLVYQYGLMRPTGNEDGARAQLRAAHDYRNVLTEIERGRRAALRDVVASLSSDLPALEQTTREASATCEEIATRLDAIRANERTRNTAALVVDELEAARSVERAALKALGAERNRVRALPEFVAAQDVIGERALALIRSARAGTSAFWGTYLRVEKAARASAAMPLWDGLSPNDPRFLRFTGEGSIGVRLQPPVDAADVFGEHAFARLRECDPSVWRGKRPRGSVALRIGSNGRTPVWAQWPMILDRPLPAGSTVTEIAAHVRRVGPREKWTLTCTIKLAAGTRASAESCGAGIVGVDIGWRTFADGSLRVAAWRDEHGEHGELRLAPDVTGRFELVDDLRAIRDLRLNNLRALLVKRLQAGDVPPWVRDASTTIAQWRAPGRFAALASRWKREGVDPLRAGDAYAALEAWRYHDYHLWRWECDERVSVANYRRDIYRKFGALLARRSSTVVFEDFDLRTMAVSRSDTETSAENSTARNARVIACTHELRTFVEQAFVARGGSCGVVSAVDSTHECAECRHVDEFDAAENLSHTCTACGVRWDQDDNAAGILVHRWRERSSDAPTMRTARRPKTVVLVDGAPETPYQKRMRLRAAKLARMAIARGDVARGAE